MITADQTLAVAESVTSGHLQAALSLATEASRFFQGGITAYNLGQKARHLHVNPIHATSCNSVSQAVADEMAVNAGSLFSSDWSIGVTGYASPLPEMGIHQLFAFYAVCFRREIICHGEVKSTGDDPLSVQLFYTSHILDQFLHCLSNGRKS